MWKTWCRELDPCCTLFEDLSMPQRRKVEMFWNFTDPATLGASSDDKVFQLIIG
jgi:hypothetical protein